MTKARGGEQVGLIFEGEQGSIIRPLHSERAVRCFIVQETELEILTYVNNKAAGFLSVGSFFVAVAASIVVSWAYSGTPNDTASAMTQVGLPCSVLLAVVMFWLAWLERRSRTAMIDRIKQESRPVGR